MSSLAADHASTITVSLLTVAARSPGAVGGVVSVGGGGVGVGSGVGVGFGVGDGFGVGVGFGVGDGFGVGLGVGVGVGVGLGPPLNDTLTTAPLVDTETTPIEIPRAETVNV